jgi:hypothetical protein
MVKPVVYGCDPVGGFQEGEAHIKAIGARKEQAKDLQPLA